MSDRPNMTRDAKIIASRHKEAEINERLEYLQTEYGILVPDLSRLILKLDAFMRVLLDDDQWVELELRYLERFAEMLDDQEEGAKALVEQQRAAQRQARLMEGVAGDHQAPGGGNRAQRRHP